MKAQSKRIVLLFRFSLYLFNELILEKSVSIMFRISFVIIIIITFTRDNCIVFLTIESLEEKQI